MQQTTHYDERLDRMLQIYERTVYKGETSQKLADEAREITDQIIREHSLFTRWRAEYSPDVD